MREPRAPVREWSAGDPVAQSFTFAESPICNRPGMICSFRKQIHWLAAGLQLRTVRSMRLATRILGWLLVIGGLVIWLGTGRHTGWTQTSVTRMEKDPVTEIEAPIIEKRFVAGVDFLGATVLPGVVLVGLSFLHRRKPLT